MVTTEYQDGIATEPGPAAGSDSGLPGDSEAPLSPSDEERLPAPLGQNESIAGLAMVALVLAGGLYFHWRPGPTVFDNWGFSLIHAQLANSMWHRITYMGSLSVLVGGSILAALVVFHRDRWRALACLIAPIIALMLAQWVLKDAVGRRYEEVVSYPSGTLTAVTALGASWIVAVRQRIRLWVAMIVAFLVGLECMAVIALRWHYPLDAVAAVVFGTGMVLLIDGLLHLAVGVVRRRQAENQAGMRPPGPAPSTGSTPADGGSAAPSGQTVGTPVS